MALGTRVMAALLVCAAGSSGTALADPTQYSHRPICKASGHLCSAHVRTDRDGNIIFHASPQGFGAADLASAYNFDTSVDPHATIAVIGAYGYAHAEADLGTYRDAYGLPDCTRANGCLRIVNQQGKTGPLPPDPPADPKNADWTMETALDLAMASAACPLCKLLLVQADNDTDLTNIFAAVDTAVTLKATVISNSWGVPETYLDQFSGHPPSYWESHFNHPGLSIFAASGDEGYDDGGAGPDYPGTSQYVVAVGGTSLYRAGNARGWSETAWSTGGPGGGAGGSACSTQIPKPAWQTSSTCTFKASADVAAIGDTDTGVAMYNSGPTAQMYGGGAWLVIGGTSAASPLVAGIFALTRAAAQPPSFAYEHPDAFNDITSGTNGTCGDILCNAQVGWDGPTGIGTPNGAQIALAQGAADGKPCGGDTDCQSRLCVASTCCNTPCDSQCGSCSTGKCAPLTGPACNDQDPCTVNDACVDGTCTGTPMDCGPATSPCTLPPTCSWATAGCVPGAAAPDGTSCDDGNPCTSADACKAGVCQGTPAQGSCPADACHQSGHCDATSGDCIQDAAKPDGTTCDDGNPCTSQDQCTAGTCAGTAITCAGPDACQVAGACDPKTGCPTTFTTAPDGTPCDDGDPSTVDDKCQGGKCAGTPSECAGKADDTSCSGGKCKAGACVAKGCGCGSAGSAPLSGIFLAAGLLALLRRRPIG